jgi:hypothetical protein
MGKECLLYEVGIKFLAYVFFPKRNSRPGDHGVVCFPHLTYSNALIDFRGTLLPRARRQRHLRVVHLCNKQNGGWAIS